MAGAPYHTCRKTQTGFITIMQQKLDSCLESKERRNIYIYMKTSPILLALAQSLNKGKSCCLSDLCVKATSESGPNHKPHGLCTKYKF